MKPKKIKSNWFTSKKEEKKKIAHSFENTFEETPEFDIYIGIDIIMQKISSIR